jgi:hypothetical protein
LAGHLASMYMAVNMYKIVFGNTAGKKPLARSRSKWEATNKVKKVKLSLCLTN